MILRKIHLSFLIILSILLFSINVYADNISVTLNGVTLDFDVQPQIISDRTFVPMRKIFESLGATVSWDDETKTVTGRKNDAVVNLSIGSNILIKNGNPKMLDVAPTIIDSRTLVPVRAIAESFDCNVEWIAESQTVKITAKANQNDNKNVLSAVQISEKVSPSVFYIEVYDANSKAVASGSGFFISSDGVAVTNYHVIEDTYSAKITTIDGSEYSVTNIISYDESLDVAIIRVSKASTGGKTVSSFPSLTLADSNQIKAGQTIYAIGSPVGLKNTISNGIISNTSQVLGEDSFIQITAPISHGSSGGALVDEYGEVLGITSAGIQEGENLGFAIPINVVKLFDLTSTGISYAEFVKSTSKFILELETDTAEIKVGESIDIRVYADGKGDDWSIYWNTEQKNIVSCKWRNWETDNICSLRITGIKEGTAVVTVYSDVDFQGKNITIYVKKPQIDYYPSDYIRVPTYTSVTGVNAIDYRQNGSTDSYTYPLNNAEALIEYVEFLMDSGFTYYKEERGDYGTIQYFYLSPEKKVLSLVPDYRWNEVRIYISR